MKRILGILATLVLGVALMGCIGDGTHVVGRDIQPGTYQNSDSSAGCYWERLRGFGGAFEEIIANDFTYGPAVVTISPTDAGFTSRGCGVWTAVADAPAAVPPTAQPTEQAPTVQPKATSTAQPGAIDTPWPIVPTRTPRPTAVPRQWNLQATCVTDVSITGSFDVPEGWTGTIRIGSGWAGGSTGTIGPRYFTGHQTFEFVTRENYNPAMKGSHFVAILDDPAYGGPVWFECP